MWQFCKETRDVVLDPIHKVIYVVKMCGKMIVSPSQNQSPSHRGVDWTICFKIKYVVIFSFLYMPKEG